MSALWWHRQGPAQGVPGTLRIATLSCLCCCTAPGLLETRGNYLGSPRMESLGGRCPWLHLCFAAVLRVVSGANPAFPLCLQLAHSESMAVLMAALSLPQLQDLEWEAGQRRGRSHGQATPTPPTQHLCPGRAGWPGANSPRALAKTQSRQQTASAGPNQSAKWICLIWICLDLPKHIWAALAALRAHSCSSCPEPSAQGQTNCTDRPLTEPNCQRQLFPA